MLIQQIKKESTVRIILAVVHFYLSEVESRIGGSSADTVFQLGDIIVSDQNLMHCMTNKKINVSTY